MQSLSKHEEKTLLRWLTHLRNTGFPAAPASAREMAEEVRRDHAASSDLRMNASFGASFGHLPNPNQRGAAGYISELVLPLAS